MKTGVFEATQLAIAADPGLRLVDRPQTPRRPSPKSAVVARRVPVSIIDVLSLCFFALFVAAVDVDFGQIGLTNDTGRDLVKWVVLIAVCVPVLGLAIISTEVQDLFRQPAVLALGAFFLWGFATVVWSLDPVRTALMWLFSATGVLAGLHWTHRHGWANVARAMVAVGTLLIIVSAFIEVASEVSGERWAGVSDSPTSLARTGTLTAVFALCLFSQRRANWPIAVGGAIGVVGIIASGTRSSLALVLAVAVVATVARSEPRNRALLATGLAATIGLLAALAAGPISNYFTRDDANVDLAEVNGRARIWPIGLDYVADRPFHGYGFGAGQTLWAEPVLDGLVQWYPRHAHQIVLELLLATGVIGLMLFAVAIVLGIRARTSSVPLVNRLLLVTLVFTGLTEAVVETESMVFPVLGIALASGARTRN